MAYHCLPRQPLLKPIEAFRKAGSAGYIVAAKPVRAGLPDAKILARIDHHLFGGNLLPTFEQDNADLADAMISWIGRLNIYRNKTHTNLPTWLLSPISTALRHCGRKECSPNVPLGHEGCKGHDLQYALPSLQHQMFGAARDGESAFGAAGLCPFAGREAAALDSESGSSSARAAAR